MEDFDFRELLFFYKERFYLILISVIIGLVVGTCYSYFIKVPMYRSSVTYILSTNTLDGQGIDSNDIALNEKLIPTYRELIKSRLIIDRVISKLSLKNMRASELADMVSLEQVNNSSMITISVNNSDPKVAQQIAALIGEEFGNEVLNIYQIKNISIIDAPLVPSTPYNNNYIKDIVIITFVSILVVIAIIFIVYTLDNTLKYSENLADSLGVPVIGCIRSVNIIKGKK